MSTKQETFDALASELPESDIVDMIVEKALSALYLDDLNPQIGFGLFINEAVDDAASEVRQEASRWRRRIYISKSAIDKATRIVTAKRR